GVIHDGAGHLKPLAPEEKKIFDAVKHLGKRHYARLNRFQHNLVLGKPNQWRCRAGARYLYICENGLVHYCSQQRGYPAIPLERYSREDLDREYHTQKSCAPFCTISCVHRVSMIDSVRQNPREAIAQFFPAKDGQPGPSMPLPVRALMWLFLPENQDTKRRLLKKAAMKMLGVS
ncbi:MAG TPA: radical SAM protein, partial [Acidobacteriota bacterium]